jgi:hypothetical protein
MTVEALQTRNDAAHAYHQQLQDLALELQNAITAITSNSISGLEESVAKQEMLCSSLSSLAKTLSNGVRSSEQPLLPSLDSDVSQKISSANRAIHDLNLQYASLLKHSGRSIALLSALCKSHTGQFPEARGSRMKHQTWSCEV